MTPAARVQTAIELLDLIVAAAVDGGASADRIVARELKDRRYAGSKDRRAIRELVFRAVRACGPVPENGRAAMLRLAFDDPAVAALFDGSVRGPQSVRRGEVAAAGGVAPQWLEERLAASGLDRQEMLALLDRAPLDVRVNRLKAARGTIVLPEAGEHLVAPEGLRFPPATPVDRWPEYADGLIEVQDGGSQLACLAVDALPGETVVDLCAGAGGKTLALAASMGNRGMLIAADVDRARLTRFAPRARRAGVAIAQSVLMNPGAERDALASWLGKADAVLVDAPCSGTGTWRRNPESRWRISEPRLAALNAIQDRLLAIAADLVRPGGRVVYIVCSLLDEEGSDRFNHWLRGNPALAAVRPALRAGRDRGEGVRITPFHDGTDGFFVACARVSC